jgi:hypothetical protein
VTFSNPPICAAVNLSTPLFFWLSFFHFNITLSVHQSRAFGFNVIEINKIPNSWMRTHFTYEYHTGPLTFELFDPNLLPYFEFAHRRTLYCIQGSSCFSYFSYILVNSYKHLKTESLNAYLPSRRVWILTVNFIITSVNPMTIMNWLNWLVVNSHLH